MSESERGSKYIKYLPAIFHGEGDAFPGFFVRFLLAFEKILSGIDDGVKIAGQSQKGIEEILDNIHNYFDPAPGKTPADFLSWLAGWMALILKEEWDEGKKRDLIARIIPLYRMRGTRKSLEEYIRIYVGADIPIFVYEFPAPLQVGFTSIVGVDTIVGEGRPYYFEIHMILPIGSRDLLERKEKGIREIIDREKPAHTYYNLITTIPTMQIAEHSTVGVDTLLGGMVI